MNRFIDRMAEWELHALRDRKARETAHTQITDHHERTPTTDQ